MTTSDPLGERHATKRRVSLEPEAQRILREFYRKARTVRGYTPTDHPSRRASVLLAELLFELWEHEGVSLPSLDLAMGARPGTARMRLARHGFRRLPPSLADAAYRGVRTGGRGSGRPSLRSDIAGLTFNKLTAIEPTGEASNEGRLWRFKCECGAERIAAAAQVKGGKVKSCGACGLRRRHR